MAIASLFGPSPEQLILARQKELRDQQLLRNQQISQQGSQFGLFAPLYQAGLRFGDIASQSIMQGLFPTVVPELDKASRIQSLVQRKDLSDPTQLRTLAQELAALGYSQEAALVATEAAKGLGTAEDRALREKELELRRAEAAKQAEYNQARLRAEEQRLGLERERVGISQQQVQMESQRKQNVGVTTRGLNVFNIGSSPQRMVTDASGNDVPYVPSVHGRFETAADRISQPRGNNVRPIKDMIGNEVGVEIRDINGNLIRREYHPGYSPPGSSPVAPAPSAAPSDRSPGRSAQAQRAAEELRKRLGQQ